MAELNDLAEKTNSVLVMEPDMSISDNINKELVSDAVEKCEESYSSKDCENTVTLDIKDFCSTGGNENEAVTDVPTYSATPNDSRLTDGQDIEEIDGVKMEENTTKTVNKIDEVSQETDSECITESVRFIQTEVQSNLFSDCSIGAIERELILLRTTMRAKKCLLSTLTRLQDHCVNLLRQKLKLVLLIRDILRNILNGLNDIQVKDLSSDLEQAVEETFRIFLQHKAVYAECKSVLEAFLQSIQTGVEINKVQKNIPEQHKAYGSTLEDIYSTKKSLLESSMKASEEFEKLINNSAGIPNQDSEFKVNLLIRAVDKGSFACTELISLGGMLKELFHCFEFCVRNIN